MLYSSISSAALDRKIGHIFQFMAYLIIIVLLSRFTALEISPLVIQLVIRVWRVTFITVQSRICDQLLCVTAVNSCSFLHFRQSTLLPLNNFASTSLSNFRTYRLSESNHVLHYYMKSQTKCHPGDTFREVDWKENTIIGYATVLDS